MLAGLDQEQGRLWRLGSGIQVSMDSGHTHIGCSQTMFMLLRLLRLLSSDLSESQGTHPHLICAVQVESNPLASKAARPPDAVHVCLSSRCDFVTFHWQIKVDDQGHLRAGGQVGLGSLLNHQPSPRLNDPPVHSLSLSLSANLHHMYTK